MTVDGNEVDPKQSAEVPPGLQVVKIHLGGHAKSQDVTATAGAVTPVKLRFDEPADVAPTNDGPAGMDGTIVLLPAP